MHEPCSASSDSAPSDAELLAAIHRAVEPVVQAARRLGPLPRPGTSEFAVAPHIAQRAALLVAAEAWLIGDGPLDRWVGANYAGGAHHRQHPLPLITELDYHRYPPTGRRDLWIQFGPAGPPELEVAA